MDYSKFRLSSFTKAEPYYTLRCGSNLELPLKYNSYEYSDLDSLVYCYDICAIPWNRNYPKNATCTILRIESTETPSGYARLKIDGDRTKDMASYYRRPRMLANVESGGPSIQEVSTYMNGYRQRHKTWLVNKDRVLAICFPYWPVEAEEWRKRKRFHGWPNEKLIARITRGGCHFVSKLRTWSSSDDTEWRFSFSKAELLLIHSWTPEQKFVYHFIRLIKKRMSKNFGGDGNKGFQTYLFKTLMLWACEEFSPEIWIKHKYCCCVRELLRRFHKCLSDKFCPNYFIPECNIMSHLKDEGGYETELKALLKFVADSGQSYACDTNVCELYLSFENKCLQITSESFPINENLNGRFGEYLSECEWFLPGMKNLHSAVEAHLRLMSIDNVTSRKESKDYVECLEHFKCALIRNEDFESFKDANPELSFYENVNVILRRKQTSNSIPIYRRSIRNSFEDDAYVRMFKESVPPSLFYIVSVYRANFHFTAMQSYKESLTECDKCLDIIIKKENEGRQFLSSLIPVLICNSLSQIYDEYLQVIIGFSTLHRNISFSESSNSLTAHEVRLKLTAIEFLKYLRIQCGHKLSVKPARAVCPLYSESNFEVPCMSQLVKNDAYSSAILFAALRQSRAYTVPLPDNYILHYRNESLSDWGP